MSGFLPFSRASLALDVIAVVMVLIVPALTWGIYVVRVQRNYHLHKRIQLALAGVLGATVVLFEVDIRLHGWRHLAAPSPYYDTWLMPVLYVHLTFAITTTLVWIVTIVAALRNFENPPKPGPHSRIHKRLARAAALGMYLTAVTGWTFYYMAFVAG